MVLGDVMNSARKAVIADDVKRDVFSVIFKYKGGGEFSTIIEEADYRLDHLLIADTQISDVCDDNSQVKVSLYLESPVSEEEARAITEELDYYFKDEEGRELDMEMIDLNFTTY